MALGAAILFLAVCICDVMNMATMFDTSVYEKRTPVA